MTLWETKCSILADLWINHRDNVLFDDFIEYNDLGLPLAYMLSESIAASTDLAVKYINETWDLFLASLEIQDTGFATLDEVLDSAVEED